MPNPEDKPLIDRLKSRQPLLWPNPGLTPAKEVLALLAASHSLTLADIEEADALLRRWASALLRLFPELVASEGLIESPLVDLADADVVTGVHCAGRCLVKCDHALPVAGSIKARGGIYEVLAFAEKLALKHGLFFNQNYPLQLLGENARALFARYTIAVGSTGNLGLSIGIMASALGFHAVVHMSHDAKAWKKDRLRRRGVKVVEHEGDYAAAVAAGHEAAAASDYAYFVDDEDSRNLFVGYAVAALRLKSQLDEMGIAVNDAQPLVVYLPCGVGGAPGGITFGLKHVFGDAVHCYFAEPCASPAMLLRLSSNDGPRSVYDIGLDNVTEADGLAVATASELVFELVHQLIAGVYTVADDELFVTLARLRQLNEMQIEPSAAAAFLGLKLIEQETIPRHPQATHVFWTTGGVFVPPEEYEKFYERGCNLLAARAAY